jgi:ATP-binding cassette subfamily B protein
VALTAAAERLMELETVFGQPATPRATPQALYDSMEAICARDLQFAYDREPVFQNADFTLPKGQFGVITGHSGIGKSTLLKLLLGIFHPTGGALVLQTADGEIPLDRTTRGLFAYVPQGNLLLSGSLRENLLLTRPEATEEELLQAIYISCMDDFLDSLPQGLDTLLGESAQGLSEGQAQRLSIARAVLRQAPVLLLDEATSALDPETEQTVLTRLRAAGKTIIAVTHRPAAVEMSDWQLEVFQGQCILHTK